MVAPAPLLLPAPVEQPTGSWLRRLGDRLARALSLTSQPAHHSAGADYGTETAIRADYDVRQALSAYAGFPFVRACAEVVALDLAQVPLTVMRGRGSAAERVDDHDALYLLEQPTSWQDRVVWESQLAVWWMLAGDGYGLMLGGRRPSSLTLMHPARCNPIPGDWGGPAAYRYEGMGPSVDYDPADVMHLRGPSWQDDPRSLRGTGQIQTLHRTLSADHAAARGWERQTATPRPGVILSPVEDSADEWDKKTRKAIADAYKASVERSGILVTSGLVNVTTLDSSLKDAEWLGGRNFTREEILAAFGVPPTKVGLPSANYATAKEQDKQYWIRQSGRMALIAGGYTKVARRFDPRARVVYDTSGIEALQESRTDRQNRVVVWVEQGVPLAEAAAFEGFEDLPEGVAPVEAAKPAGETEEAKPAGPVEPVADADKAQDTALNGAQVSAAKEIIQDVAAGLLPYDSGVSMLQVFFNLDEATAKTIMGPVGKSFFSDTTEAADTDGDDGAAPEASPRQVAVAALTGRLLVALAARRAPAVAPKPAPPTEVIDFEGFFKESA